ncbi:MAG: flagellar basal body-associated FliL family protein [Lachnospiraceae bacterium]|nr:flagellar basal body-associated FliL family protein [Lachnospiraceae bacterium]
MKKNLMTIIILALLLVNTVMTGIAMFSVITTNSAVVDLVKKISLAVDVDMGTASPVESSTGTGTVDISNIETYNIADQLTIKLKNDPEEEKDRFAVVGITLSLNTQDPDYATYGDLSTREGLIKDEINKVIGSYTYSEIQEVPTEVIQEKILENLQALFNSKFICGVSFSTWLTQ